MYKKKYIFGKLIKYKGEIYKVIGIKFTVGGVLYKLDGIREWISEKEV